MRGVEALFVLVAVVSGARTASSATDAEWMADAVEPGACPAKPELPSLESGVEFAAPRSLPCPLPHPRPRYGGVAGAGAGRMLGGAGRRRCGSGRRRWGGTPSTIWGLSVFGARGHPDTARTQQEPNKHPARAQQENTHKNKKPTRIQQEPNRHQKANKSPTMIPQSKQIKPQERKRAQQGDH